MRTITFKLDEELLERLESIARLKGVTRSDAIREAIELYLYTAELFLDLPPLKKEGEERRKPKIVRLTS